MDRHVSLKSNTAKLGHFKKFIGNRNGTSTVSGTTATQPYKSRVLRTIYLPSEKADTLLLTVESLQKQLGAVKELEAGRNVLTN